MRACEVVLIAGVIALPTSCGTQVIPTGVETRTAAHGSVRVITADAVAPTIVNIQTRHSNGHVRITGHLVSTDGRPIPPYVGAAYTYDGWGMQVFVDTDSDSSTGYEHGYEFVVRCIEPAGTHRVLVRRTEGGTPENPLGWGPVVGTAGFRLFDDKLKLDLDLAALDGDDGAMNFGILTWVGGGGDRWYTGTVEIKQRPRPETAPLAQLALK